MEVLLLSDVVNVGLAGQIKKVTEGYARNFLFPRKLAIQATERDVAQFRARKQQEVVDEQVIGSRVAMLAQHIKNMAFVIKKKVHDNGRLYGAVGQDEVVALLAEKNIHVNRKQIEFDKAIRATGEYEVFVRLTSKLKPTLKLKVVAE